MHLRSAINLEIKLRKGGEKQRSDLAGALTLASTQIGSNMLLSTGCALSGLVKKWWWDRCPL